ncbi:MAG TPA: response regulator, partial [Anaerolineaceae bacterium]|nr:response regulator [Anaerolineaceae bacterium]
YDALLLDVELPDMDGLSVTRELTERLTGDQRPRRIAVTAHVGTGDRQRFLAGGMDDYLSKPIVKADLAAALARALPAEPVDRCRLEAYFETAGTDWQSVLAEVSSTYLETVPGWLAALRQAALRAAWPEAFRVAHSLRSASAQLAAGRLAALAGRLERDAEGLAQGAPWPAPAAPFTEQLVVIEAEFDAVNACLKAG